MVGNFCTRASGLHVGDIRKGGQTMTPQERMNAAARGEEVQPAAKPYGHPLTFEYDIQKIERLLDNIGAPRLTGQTTRIGDILTRLVWLQFNSRLLEHAEGVKGDDA